MTLRTERIKSKAAGYLSGRFEFDRGKAKSTAIDKSRKTPAGPFSTNTQRQLVRVLISRKRQIYCRGKVSSVKNKISRSHSVLDNRNKILCLSLSAKSAALLLFKLQSILTWYHEQHFFVCGIFLATTMPCTCNEMVACRLSAAYALTSPYIIEGGLKEKVVPNGTVW